MERPKILRSRRSKVDAGAFELWAVSVAIWSMGLWMCYLCPGQKSSHFPQDLPANTDMYHFALRWRRQDQIALHLALAEHDFELPRP
jgi:hypothetical protein